MINRKPTTVSLKFHHDLYSERALKDMHPDHIGVLLESQGYLKLHRREVGLKTEDGRHPCCHYEFTEKGLLLGLDHSRPHFIEAVKRGLEIEREGLKSLPPHSRFWFLFKRWLSGIYHLRPKPLAS